MAERRKGRKQKERKEEKKGRQDGMQEGRMGKLWWKDEKKVIKKGGKT